MKYNDIVSEMSHDRTEKYQARVNWVENGQVGITYLEPKGMRGGCSVVNEGELTLISASAKDEIAEKIASIDDKELEEHIMSIRRRRAPKQVTTRKKAGKVGVVKEKKVSFDELFKKMDENPNKK